MHNDYKFNNITRNLLHAHPTCIHLIIIIQLYNSLQILEYIYYANDTIIANRI